MRGESPGDPGQGLNAALDDVDGPPFPPTALGIVGWVLGRQKARVAVGALSGIAWMGAIALIPVAVGGAIDGAVDGGTGADVVFWCAVLAAVVLTEAVAGVIRHRSAQFLYSRTRWLLERLVTRRVLDPRGGADADPGTLLSHARTDTQAVGGIGDLMCRGSGAIVTFLAVGIGMLATSPLLGLLVLLGLPPCLLVLAPLWRPYGRRAAAQQETMAGATSVAADSLAGLRIVKGLGGEPTVRGWFAESTAAVRTAAVALARLGWAWNAIASVVPGVFLAVVLYLAGRLALDGALTPGQLVTFTGLAVFLAIPLATLAEVGEVWATGLAGARRIATVLAEPPAVPDDGDATPLVGGIVLHGLRIADGELLGLACADPRDAASLADLLARRVDGTVAVAGVEAAQLPLEVLRAHVLVDDRPWLLDGTVRDNVALGAPHASDDALLDALLAAGADEIAVRGLDERLGERGLALSGGPRQRVVLARALAAGIPVLVLDDPTSALDTVTEARVASRLRDARSGRTTVLLTTSPTLLAACDRVAFVVDGRAEAGGTHSELLAQHPRYRALVSPTEGAPS